MEEFFQRLQDAGFTNDEIAEFLRSRGIEGNIDEADVDARVEEATTFLADQRELRGQQSDISDTEAAELADQGVEVADQDAVARGRAQRVRQGEASAAEEAAQEQADRDDQLEEQAAQLGVSADLLRQADAQGISWMQDFGYQMSPTEARLITGQRLGVPVDQVTDDMVREELGSATPENTSMVTALTTGLDRTVTIEYGPQSDRQSVSVLQSTIDTIGAAHPMAQPYITQLAVANARAGGNDSSLYALAAVATQAGLLDVSEAPDFSSELDTIRRELAEAGVGEVVTPDGEEVDRDPTFVLDGPLPAGTRSRSTGSAQRPTGRGSWNIFDSVNRALVLAEATTEEGERGLNRLVQAINGSLRSVQMERMSENLNEAEQKYGDWTLAFISAGGRDDLAQKLWNDPWSLTPEERNTLGQMITEGRWSPQDAAAAGLFVNPEKFSFIMGLATGEAGGGGGGQTITVPDHAGLQESYRDIFRGLMLRDPTDEELSAYSSSIQSITAARFRSETRSRNSLRNDPAPDVDRIVESVDPQGRALQGIRNSAEYQRLYERRRPGESEQDYQQRIAAPSTRLFSGTGGDVATGDIREGMLSGDAGTTTGRTFFGTGSAGDNSSFEERMARLGDSLKGAI